MYKSIFTQPQRTMLIVIVTVTKQQVTHCMVKNCVCEFSRRVSVSAIEKVKEGMMAIGLMVKSYRLMFHAAR